MVPRYGKLVPIYFLMYGKIDGNTHVLNKQAKPSKTGGETFTNVQHFTKPEILIQCTTRQMN